MFVLKTVLVNVEDILEFSKTLQIQSITTNAGMVSRKLLISLLTIQNYYETFPVGILFEKKHSLCQLRQEKVIRFYWYEKVIIKIYTVRLRPTKNDRRKLDSTGAIQRSEAHGCRVDAKSLFCWHGSIFEKMPQMGITTSTGHFSPNSWC